MDYKGYKLIDKIILVGKSPRKEEEHMQAYLVDPSNKKQLESAYNWARWNEYGPYDRDTRKYEWTIEHNGTEFEFDNSGFTLELLDCAGGSSQGGKLSFWNCLVSKNEQTFMIGINSDMLLDLLKNATFINGKCQSELVFITCKGKVGMTVKGSDTYEQCIKDQSIKDSIKSKSTTKFAFGNRIQTATIHDIYLGKLTKYYSFDLGGQDFFSYGSRRYFDPRKCTITKLAKPVEYHLTEYDNSRDGYESISDIISYYNRSSYAIPQLLEKCPKRALNGILELDISEEDFYKIILDKIYNYDKWLEQRKQNSWYNDYTEEYNLCLFLDRKMFGLGTEPFELDEELLKKIKAAGIKYVEEGV